MISRETARKHIINRLKYKNKKLNLETIEKLVDEYIETAECIETKNLIDIKFPSSLDIKLWFQDPPDNEFIELEDGTKEELYEIDVDNICLNDPLGTKIFKNFYNWSWKKGEIIPPEIKELIHIAHNAFRLKNKGTKEESRIRIINLTMVGIIRYYHLERKPYLCPSQIVHAVDFLKQSLLFLSKVEKGKFNNTEIKEKLYIFAPFKETT